MQDEAAEPQLNEDLEFHILTYQREAWPGIATVLPFRPAVYDRIYDFGVHKTLNKEEIEMRIFCDLRLKSHSGNLRNFLQFTLCFNFR